MVLFSRGAVRGLHVLMILVWFSRSSLAETTEAGTLGTQTTGAGTLGTQSTGVGTLGTQTTGVGTQETETVMSTVTDIVTMSMTTTASAPSGGETTTATTTAAAIITTTPTVAVPVTEAATTLAPPDPPGDVAAMAINTTAFSVTWSHTDNMTEFIVSFTSAGGGDDDEIADVESGVVVAGRIPGEQYTIIVVAELNNMQEESNSTTVRLFPESVDNLAEVDDTTRNSSYIQVVWDRPCCNVTGYEMNCSSGYPLKSSLSEDDNIGTCINITAGDNITVTVTSVIDSGSDSVVKGDPESKVVTAYPNIIENLRILSRTSSSVSVKWDEPGGIFEEYIIECAGDAIPLNASLPSDVRSLVATCINVKAGSIVDVTVSTRSGVKQNPTSILVEALPGIVVGLQEFSATTNSVNVNWTLPSDHINGTYKYSADSSDGNVECTVASSNTEAECTNVTPGSLITVTVTTVNGDLNNTASTPAQAYPYAVSDVTEGDPTTSSVSVSWEDPGGEVEGYVVSCSNRDPNSTVIIEEDDSLNFTCGGLSGGETVTITIYTVSGDKNTSAPFELTARPNQVVNLRELLVGTDFVQASWEKPNGTVTEYLITCSNGTASPKTVVEDGSSPYKASCEDVFLPGGDYTITVTPYSSNVFGENDSIPITAQPAAPVKLGNTSTVNSVSVSWSAPRGEVDYYRVECDNGAGEEINVTGSDLTATCNVDTPGESYLISVMSVSSRQFSDPATWTVTALPEKVTLTEGGPTVTTVQASWQKPRGIVDSFEVSCGPGENATAENPAIYVNDSVTNYTGKCSVEIPGGLYTMEVTSVSNEKRSATVKETLRALPSNVGSLEGSGTVDSITVTWDKPAGVVDSYDTSIVDDDGETVDSDSVSETTVTFRGLTPGTYYNISVCSRSGDQTCVKDAITEIRTIPTRPSPPRNVTASDPQVHSVTITFLSSKHPNGIIMNYIIHYKGEKDESDPHIGDVIVLPEKNEDENSNYTEVIGNLYPGFTYDFNVLARNDHLEPSENSSIVTASTSQDAPTFSTNVETPVSSEPGVRDFKLFIDSELFDHCNGEILYYTVLLNGVQKIPHQDYPYAPDYSNCGGGNARKRRQTGQDIIEVTIGDGTMSDGEYKNDKLRPKTNYTINIRAINEVGRVDSLPTFVTTEPVNPAAYVVPIFFVLLLIIVLVGYIVWKERKDPGSVKNKIFRNGGVDNPGFITDKPMRRTGNARPVKLSGFALHLEDMSRDSDYLFSEEYNDLRPVGKNQADDAAKQDYNKVKNRFSNILPYDHTRVKLMPNDDDPGSDFINANYMIGARSNREYIACQGPLQNTEEDMWRMVWEQGASLIVMVTQLMEGSKIKCHQYWPQDGEGPVRYGDIIVLAHGTEHNELWVKRLFTMTKGPLSREIVHYNFTAWPDHGVPDSPDHLIKFVQAVRGSKKHDGKPVVVHCSAGVGRTGTFISLDTLMTQMESSDEVDIFGLVRKMRMNRCLMVQTEVQYIYIHQCVMALLEGSTDNTYENYNGNEDPYYNEALI